MKQNGFTLIELLAVILIILALYTVIVPIVSQNIDKAENFATNAQIKLIEESAYIYSLENKNEIPTLDTNNIVLITVQDLLDKGLIENKDLKVNNRTTVYANHKIIIVKVDDIIKTIYDKKQESKPIILLNGPTSIKIVKNGVYEEYGANLITLDPLSITELSSSNISSTVNVTKFGDYTVNYTYTGANSVVRNVSVGNENTGYDDEKPVITLNGNDTITISQKSSYFEQGATATDNKDGNITSRIVISGTVNTYIKGTYYVKYDVTDFAGNKAITKVRTVIIN